MKSGIATFEMIAELQRLAERAFIYKLRRKHPNVTAQEIGEELRKWYKDRPGAEFGDGVGRVRNLSNL